MHLAKLLIDYFFGISLFINAMLFIPQIIRLVKQKHAKDISLLTFGGFCIMQIAAILYGVVQNDGVIVIGYLLSVVACGTVAGLIIYYRIKNK